MTRNQILAIAIFAIVATIALAMTIYIWFCDEAMLQKFDSRIVKAALTANTWLISTVIAILLYTHFYDIPKHRMTRNNIAWMKMTGLAGAVAPFGLFGLERFEGSGISITFHSAGISAAVMFGIAAYAVCILDAKYSPP